MTGHAAIAVGTASCSLPNRFQMTTNTKMRDRGGPLQGCDQCHRGIDAYTYGMVLASPGHEDSGPSLLLSGQVGPASQAEPGPAG
jgi:hypothetical protein